MIEEKSSGALYVYIVDIINSDSKSVSVDVKCVINITLFVCNAHQSSTMNAFFKFQYANHGLINY